MMRPLVTMMQKAAAAGGSDDPRAHIAHDSAEMVRACIADCMNRTAFYGSFACDYVDANDDTGLDYSIRQATAALRQGINLLKLLKETKRRDAERRDGEPAAEMIREFRG